MPRRPSLTIPTPPSVAAPESAQQPPSQAKPSTRAGKRAVAFWIDDAAYEELKIAVARRRITLQTAGEEMLSTWMRDQGMRLPQFVGAQGR